VDALEIDGDASFAAFERAVIALGLSGVIQEPALDGVNGTPFTLYNASLRNEKALSSVGLAFNTPSEKLGFHSDGMIGCGGIYVPNTLMIHNLLVAYECPGNFYWAPSVSWPERDRFEDLFGLNRKFRIAITPIAYGDGVKLLKIVGEREIEAPIFWGNGKDRAVFLNGEVLSQEAPLIAEMRDSIAWTADKFRVPQRLGRTVFIRNSAGFHARDVMQRPLEGTKYTRSMIRSVDRRGFQIA